MYKIIIFLHLDKESECANSLTKRKYYFRPIAKEHLRRYGNNAIQEAKRRMANQQQAGNQRESFERQNGGKLLSFKFLPKLKV